MLNYLLCFIFLATLGCATIKTSPDINRTTSSESDFVPEFDRQYRVKKRIYLHTNPKRVSRAVSKDDYKDNTTGYKIIPENTYVMFSMRKLSSISTFQWPLLIVGSSSEGDGGGYDFKLFPNDILTHLESTDRAAIKRHWQHNREVISYIHLQMFSTSFMVRVYSANNRKPYVFTETSVLFHPNLESCHENEIAFGLGHPKNLALTKNYRSGIKKEFPDNVPLVSSAEPEDVFCLSLEDFNNNTRFVSTQPTREMTPWEWSDEAIEKFYQRTLLPQIELFPDFGLDIGFKSLNLGNGKYEYPFHFYRALIGSCSGQCRLQGFTIVLDQKGLVKRIDIDRPKNKADTPHNTLYYWDNSSREEIPFENGDWQRIVDYSNDKSFLAKHYANLSGKYFGAYDENFTATMSKIYKDIDKTNSARQKNAQAGSALVTYFVVLAQARAVLLSKNEHIDKDEVKSWPNYKSP